MSSSSSFRDPMDVIPPVNHNRVGQDLVGFGLVWFYFRIFRTDICICIYVYVDTLRKLSLGGCV